MGLFGNFDIYVKRGLFGILDCSVKKRFSQYIPFLGIDGINENSSEDFSTPSNKHKEDDCDKMDMTSTSKRLCTKIIKKEKTKTD
ncbi:unnamed protein product [Brassica rapa]|uniref:Uncharacterized protein n=1 Tax=Brassica campestris TaxID=3711 RepID=A0A8D9LWE9_BRACM|nr:unnamed protein product [Brassica rapa]